MNARDRRRLESLLLRELARSRHALDELRDEARHAFDADEGGTSAAPFVVTDRTVESAEQEVALSLATHEASAVDSLRDALRHLRDDPTTFGLCDRRGRQIPFARLELVPDARYCMRCSQVG